MLNFTLNSDPLKKLKEAACYENLAMHGLPLRWIPASSDMATIAGYSALAASKHFLKYPGDVSNVLGVLAGDMNNSKWGKQIKAMYSYNVMAHVPHEDSNFNVSSKEIGHMLAQHKDLPEIKLADSILAGVKNTELLRSATLRRELFDAVVHDEAPLFSSIEARTFSDFFSAEMDGGEFVDYYAERAEQNENMPINADARRWLVYSNYITALVPRMGAPMDAHRFCAQALEKATRKLVALFSRPDRCRTRAEFEEALLCSEVLSAVVCLTNSKLPMYCCLEACRAQVTPEDYADLFEFVNASMSTVFLGPDFNYTAIIPEISREILGREYRAAAPKEILRKYKTYVAAQSQPNLSPEERLIQEDILDKLVNSYPRQINEMERIEVDNIFLASMALPYPVILAGYASELHKLAVREGTFYEFLSAVDQTERVIDLYNECTSFFLISSLPAQFSSHVANGVSFIRLAGKGGVSTEDMDDADKQAMVDEIDAHRDVLNGVFADSARLINPTMSKFQMMEVEHTLAAISEISVDSADALLKDKGDRSEIQEKLAEISRVSSGAALTIDSKRLVQLSNEIVAMEEKISNAGTVAQKEEALIAKSKKLLAGLFLSPAAEPTEAEESSATDEALHMVIELEQSLAFVKGELAGTKSSLHDQVTKTKSLESQLSSQQQSISSGEVAKQIPAPLLKMFKDEGANITPAETLEILDYTLGDSILILPSAIASAKESYYLGSGRILREVTTLCTDYLAGLKEGLSDDMARKCFASKVFRANESTTVSESIDLRAQREFMHDGKKEYFDKHLAIGNKASNQRHIRIYFKADLTNSRIVVAYCGNHLDTTQSS